MGKIFELKTAKNHWKLSSLGGRMVGWTALDKTDWRAICRGDLNIKPSEDNYRAAIMFPWVNRIGGDHWSLEGHPVPVNTSGKMTNLHGLVADYDWDVVTSSDSKVVFHTVLNPQKHYPRMVEATVSYSIGKTNGAESLDIQIMSKNLEASEMAYVTTGFHPYFLNPFGGKIDEMELFCAAEKEFPVDENMIPTGVGDVTIEHDFRKSHQIGATLFDSGFVLKAGVAPVAVLTNRNYKLMIFPGENCGFMQIYIPPHREEIAMEPQTGGADAYRFHQYGLKRLKPGESFNYSSSLVAQFS